MKLEKQLGKLSIQKVEVLPGEKKENKAVNDIIQENFFDLTDIGCKIKRYCWDPRIIKENQLTH